MTAPSENPDGPPVEAPDNDNLWVKTVPTGDGGYRIGIAVGRRADWTLTPDGALAYGQTCLRRAAEAEHDSAVMRLLTDKGLDPDIVGQVIARDLRPDRIVDNAGTAPLEFRPGISSRGYAPFLTILFEGEPIGQLDPDALRDHALQALEAHAVADLDTAVERYLARGDFPRNTAHAVVHGLAEYRDARETPREKLARVEGRAESLRAAVHEVDDDEAAALLNERCQQWEHEAALMRGDDPQPVDPPVDNPEDR